MEKIKEIPPEFKIPDEVYEAMKTYYDHQVLANATFSQYDGKEPDKVYHWDKDRDVEIFDNAAKKCGVGYEKIAGTFYLTVQYNKNLYVTVVTHNKSDLNHNGYLVRVYERNPDDEKQPAPDRFANIF